MSDLVVDTRTCLTLAGVGTAVAVSVGVAASRFTREHQVKSQRANILKLCEETDDRCQKLNELLAHVEVKLEDLKNKPNKTAKEQKMHTEVTRIWTAGTAVRVQGVDMSGIFRHVCNTTLSARWDIEVMGVYEEIMKTLSGMSGNFERYFERFVVTGNDWSTLEDFHIISTSAWEKALNTMAKFYSQYGSCITGGLAVVSVISFLGAVVCLFGAIAAAPIAAGVAIGSGVLAYGSYLAEQAANTRYNDASKAYDRFCQHAATLKELASKNSANVTEHLKKMLPVLQDFNDLVKPKVAVSEVNCSICLQQIILGREPSSQHDHAGCNLFHCHHHIDLDEQKEADPIEDAVRPITDSECKHIFHRGCLRQYLHTSRNVGGMAKCPECRAQFNTIASVV